MTMTAYTVTPTDLAASVRAQANELSRAMLLFETSEVRATRIDAVVSADAIKQNLDRVYAAFLRKLDDAFIHKAADVIISSQWRSEI